MYPLLFKPNLHPVVWGGKRLTKWKELSENEAGFSPDTPIGESWEVSCVPSSLSVISNGRWKGKTLAEIIEKFPEATLGPGVVERYEIGREHV